MSDRDHAHLLGELQAARRMIERLERQFGKLHVAVLENTGTDLDGKTTWPDWVVETLDGMGLWVPGDPEITGRDF